LPDAFSDAEAYALSNAFSDADTLPDANSNT
jgi:hypothetical protein